MLKIASYTDQDLQQVLNQGKEVFLKALETEKLLNGKAEEISRKYLIIVYRKGFFGRLFDKMFGGDENDLYTIVAKVVLPSPDDSTDE